MERNDKLGYHTQKLESAIKAIDWLNNRIEWLEDGKKHCLILEEISALVRMHRKAIADYEERRDEAQKWIDAQTMDIDPEWLDEKTERLADLLLGEQLPLDFVEAGEVLIRAGQKITKTMLRATAIAWKKDLLSIDPSPIRNRVWEIMAK